jgi:uncharacterized protein
VTHHLRSSPEQTVGGMTRQLTVNQDVGVERALPLVGIPSLTEPRWPARANCSRPPLPPFTVETASKKLRLVEAAWNAFDPHLIAVACTPNSLWRSKDVHLVGRAEIVEFLTLKRYREIDFALRMALWSFCDNRIAARVHCEYTDAAGRSWRGYGIELWEFDADGLIRRREDCINKLPIDLRDRRIRGSRTDTDRLPDLPLR